jgi:hypothetical protein
MDLRFEPNKKRTRKLETRLAVKQTSTRSGSVRSLRSHARITPREADGILVQEDELSLATAQHLYRIRCECGRSWFELELKMLVKCPACSRLNRVQLA